MTKGIREGSRRASAFGWSADRCRPSQLFALVGEEGLHLPSNIEFLLIIFNGNNWSKLSGVNGETRQLRVGRMLERVMEWIRCNLYNMTKCTAIDLQCAWARGWLIPPVNRRHKPRNIADDNAERKNHNCIINGDVIITSNYGAFHPSRSYNCGVRLKQLILPLHVVCSVSTTYHRWHHAARNRMIL